MSHRLPARLKHDEYTRFILLSRARTGSNLLTSLLDSHPQIDAEGELLRNLDGRSVDELLDQTFAAQPRFIKAKGFKFFYYHPVDGDSQPVWDELVDRRELAVVHLRRRNILRAVVSRKIANRDNTWLEHDDRRHVARPAKAICLSPAELEGEFRQTRAWEEEGDRRFVDHRMLPVWYEDLVDDIESTFATVTDFLGVRRARPRTTMRRQNPEPLRDLLLNHDELRAVFTGSPWEAFFDE